MSRSFNLVDECWIPCVTAMGAVEYRGILGTLTDAKRYAEIRDESPLVTIAIHRFLLTVLHRVFGPADPSSWVVLWRNGLGEFDPSALKTYLHGSYHSHFDLFDPTHPLFQTAALPLGDPDKKNMGRPKYVKPIRQLAHELAYSDGLNLFAHFDETNWETRPADEVARWLVAFQSFAHSNLVTTEEGQKAADGSADAAQLVKSAVVLVRGVSLFQTLMLNLVHYSAEDDEPFAFKATKDKPAWEKPGPTSSRESAGTTDPKKRFDRSYDGYLDLLTWQSRRVKLVPERDVDGELLGVSGVVCMKGWQLPGFDRFERETMIGFVRADKAKPGQDPWPPLGFREGRELWRDSHTLFQSVAEKSERPRVLSWVNYLRREGFISSGQVSVDVFGLSSNTAKIFFWRHESLPLPLAYLTDDALVGQLRSALQLAEEVADALGEAAKHVAKTRLAANFDSRPDSKRVGKIVEAMAPERFYWSRLELPFRTFMTDLAAAAADARDAKLFDWYWDVLDRTAVWAFDRCVAVIDTGRDLKAVTAGWAVLRAKLRDARTTGSFRIPDRVKAGAP